VEGGTEEFQARTGIKCHLERSDADIGVNKESATALFRIVQETLTNVARHANASEVNIRLAGLWWSRAQARRECRTFPAPPHRTGHADFPHPALRSSSSGGMHT
jgi:hypothetical protein